MAYATTPLMNSSYDVYMMSGFKYDELTVAQTSVRPEPRVEMRGVKCQDPAESKTHARPMIACGACGGGSGCNPPPPPPPAARLGEALWVLLLADYVFPLLKLKPFSCSLE